MKSKKSADKTEIKNPPVEEERHLTPWQVLALERSIFEHEVAGHELMAAHREKHARDLAARLSMQQCDTMITEAAAKHTRAKEAHRQLAASLATAYGIDWAKYAYDSETGRLTATEE